MTQERIAELRALAEAAAKCDGPYEGEWTIERDRACRAALRAYRTAASDALPELLDELEALAAQVAMLREALESAERVLETASGCEWCYSEAVPVQDAAQKALADTEAAATAWLEAHDREQRLAGARELAVRASLKHDESGWYGGPVIGYYESVHRVLGAMEHEASRPD